MSDIVGMISIMITFGFIGWFINYCREEDARRNAKKMEIECESNVDNYKAKEENNNDN